MSFHNQRHDRQLTNLFLESYENLEREGVLSQSISPYFQSSQG